MFVGKQKRSPCYDWAPLVQGITTVNSPQTIQQDTPDGVYNNTIEEEMTSVMHEQLLNAYILVIMLSCNVHSKFSN